MSQSIHLSTSIFNPLSEPKNPINPIYGRSLLDWLKKELSGQLAISEPEAEDWGWYSELNFNDQHYTIGACALTEDELPDSKIEWVFQVDKNRSLKEKLLGRNKMDSSDSCLKFFYQLFNTRPEFEILTNE